MWTGSAGPNGTKPAGLHGDAELSASEPGTSSRPEIASGRDLQRRLFNEAPRADIAAHVNWKYVQRAARTYWTRSSNGGSGRITHTACLISVPIGANWAFGYLTRFHGHAVGEVQGRRQTTRCRGTASRLPRSGGEQYATTYRTEKTAVLNDDATSAAR